MNHKKIFYYNILLYISIFLIEALTLVANQMNKFAQGKVLSSLFDYSLSVISLDLIRYTITVCFIYLACAYANSIIINYIAGTSLFHKTSRMAEKSSFYVFVVYNGLFILALYLFNQVLYPLSEQVIWDSLQEFPVNLVVVRFLFFFFGLLYALLIMAAVGKHGKRAGVFFFILVTGVITYNYLPHFRAENPGRAVAASNPKYQPVIILGVDSLRTDQLTPFGASEKTLPHVEQFLEQSIIFKDAHTPLARTFPSWMSILTGNYPVNSGARYNLIKRNRLQEQTPFLSKNLQNRGYETIFAIDETRFCNITHDDGFDAIISPPPGMIDFVLGNFHDFTLSNLFFNNRLGYLLFPFAENNRAIPHLYSGIHFVDDVLLRLDSTNPEKGVFLAMHLCAAHWPYKISGNSSGFSQSPDNASDQAITPHYTNYGQALQIADAQLGRIIDGLKQRNLYDQALIVVLSDHGESFGDSDSWGHGTSLFDDAQNHILISIKPPFSTLSEERNDLASTVDIAPTILDMLAIPHAADLYDGRPLLGHSSADTEDRKIFMETGFHLFHKEGQGFTMAEMIRMGHEFYEPSPENGLITVRDSYHEEILAQKQLAVRSKKWQLILQKKNQGQWSSVLFDLNKPRDQRHLLPPSLSSTSDSLALIQAAERHFKIKID